MSEDEEKVKRYDQLMTDHKGLVIKVCQTYCRGDVEKARDLFQDIALEIWTHMDTFKEKSKEATWLWHLAVNTAIDKKCKKTTKVRHICNEPRKLDKKLSGFYYEKKTQCKRA